MREMPVEASSGSTFLFGDVADDFAVLHLDDAVAEMLSEVAVMGDADDEAGLGKFPQCLEDRFAGIGVEGAGRFVGEDDLRVFD